MKCIDKNTGKVHRIRWYWVDPRTRQRTRANAGLRVGYFGWDAVCSCGYDTRTGGAIRASVERRVWVHKWDAENGFLDSNGQPTYR